MTAARERANPEPEIYKVDTVPPPAGEDSAYDAVTKVGPMARAAVAHLFAEAEGNTARVTSPPRSGIQSKATPKTNESVRAAAAADSFAIPKAAPLTVLYTEAEDDDTEDSLFEPTGVAELAPPTRRVAPNAKSPAVAASGTLAKRGPVAKSAPAVARSAPPVAKPAAPVVVAPKAPSQRPAPRVATPLPPRFPQPAAAAPASADPVLHDQAMIGAIVTAARLDASRPVPPPPTVPVRRDVFAPELLARAPANDRPPVAVLVVSVIVVLGLLGLLANAVCAALLR